MVVAARAGCSCNVYKSRNVGGRGKEGEGDERAKRTNRSCRRPRQIEMKENDFSV